MPTSPGSGLPVSQYWLFQLPKAPLPVLLIPGPGGGSSVLSGAPSSEPLHLQHEKPGAESCTEQSDFIDIFHSW